MVCRKLESALMMNTTSSISSIHLSRDPFEMILHTYYLVATIYI